MPPRPGPFPGSSDRVPLFHPLAPPPPRLPLFAATSRLLSGRRSPSTCSRTAEQLPRYPPRNHFKSGRPFVFPPGVLTRAICGPQRQLDSRSNGLSASCSFIAGTEGRLWFRLMVPATVHGGSLLRLHGRSRPSESPRVLLITYN